MVAGEGDVVWRVVVLGCDACYEPRLGEEGVDQWGNGPAILYSERSILFPMVVADCISARAELDEL